ncbi:MAG: hypothetical protein A2W93_05060 [Bacteroidetes bacterium GWF2_43_63]|nr:MAG: hypothetical protein A2W94_12090 [Bacteroidetes bacterium GWE2_42_42]OFY56247.1 MAG: hypothetical protein A2W93_05060 [Bacteroidetes bacterium GWF2_43_63]HBG71921.1 hypothetical protein [Bacteroidales bacterium]HCB61822.1 hypothetical protein [Bacteroidales bacterium]HCY23844.1 hypothetical protein [Bacteroidales bacterium]
MPSKNYFLDRENKETLGLSWKAGFRTVTVSFNGVLLSTMNREEVSAGKAVELPDGRNVDIKLEGGFYASLTAKINGRHIPGTQGDPKYQLKQVFYLTIVLGILNIIIGSIFSISNIQIDGLESIGYINVAIGLVYIALGYAVMQGSMIALILITLILFGDLILAAMYSAQSGMTAGIIMKVFFVIFVVRGFKYMKEFRAEKNEL